MLWAGKKKKNRFSPLDPFIDLLILRSESLRRARDDLELGQGINWDDNRGYLCGLSITWC